MTRIVVIVACGFLMFSVPGSAQSKADAKKLADVLTGDSAGQAAENRQCKMFTKEEASGYVGEALTEVENAAQGTGCQWNSADYEASVLLQVVPAEYHVRPTLAQGFKELPEIGPQAFIIPEFGGWHAGSLQGDRSLQVMTSGKGASEAKTVELLKEALKRGAATPAQ